MPIFLFEKNHLVLALSLIAWCILHSAMISGRGVALAQHILRSQFRFYRLIYNIIAILTLIPIFLLWRNITPVSYVDWSGGLRIFQLVLWGTGFYLLLAGLKHYDGLQFLGFRQILSKKHAITLSESGDLHTRGILKVTRHPWYLAGFLVLWARDINSVSLIFNIIFSMYLVLGAMLEERKLRLEFGQVYVDYQKNVSMFFPWKWLKIKVKKNESRAR